MENIIEVLYDIPRGRLNPECQFAKLAKIKNEHWEMLNESLSAEQQDLMDGYSDVDGKMQGIMKFENFRYAFHLGAQFMAEIIEGRKELLED